MFWVWSGAHKYATRTMMNNHYLVGNKTRCQYSAKNGPPKFGMSTYPIPPTTPSLWPKKPLCEQRLRLLQRCVLDSPRPGEVEHLRSSASWQSTANLQKLYLKFAIFENFWRARSRLYQNEFLQEKMRLTAFFKLYKICQLQRKFLSISSNFVNK